MKQYLKKIVIITFFACLIAVLISKISTLQVKDIFFMEGITLIIIGILSAISGNSKGLSIQGLGSQNAQYISNANLEIEKVDKSRKIKKERVEITNINIILIVAGIICILINFII